MSFTGGYQSTQAGGGQNGAVFITDIISQNMGDNVGGKTYDESGKVLLSCIADTDLVQVHVLALTGHALYQPEIRVMGQLVSLSESVDQGVWTGQINIDRQGTSSITATHNDGPSSSCTIMQDIGPEITMAEFTGGYPSGQTELKAGDTFQVWVTTDTPMERIEVVDFGAGINETIDFSATQDKTIAITIANRGNSPQSLGLRLRAKNANGSFGGYYETASAGSINGTHVVVVNNLHPTIAVLAINYPIGQGALKDSESALVDHAITNFDSVTYSSPTGELSITNSSNYESSKSVARIAGDYNANQNNLEINAIRQANGATLIANAMVRILMLHVELRYNFQPLVCNQEEMRIRQPRIT